MATQRKVDEVLNHPEDYEWTIQGFGMLRTYLDAEQVERLHIWDAPSGVIDVSTIHDHPWDFDSTIHYGELVNIRFEEAQGGIRDLAQHTLHHSQLFCGVGGGLRGATTLKHMNQLADEWYERGQSYSMEAPEVHESYPTPGAVTVIRRKFHADRDLANVFWLEGTEWVSAVPREATPEEVRAYINKARAARRASF